MIKEDQYKIDEIVRHIRNSVAHGRVTPISKDRGRNKKITTNKELINQGG